MLVIQVPYIKHLNAVVLSVENSFENLVKYFPVNVFQNSNFS